MTGRSLSFNKNGMIHLPATQVNIHIRVVLLTGGTLLVFFIVQVGGASLYVDAGLMKARL